MPITTDYLPLKIEYPACKKNNYFQKINSLVRNMKSTTCYVEYIICRKENHLHKKDNQTPREKTLHHSTKKRIPKLESFSIFITTEVLLTPLRDIIRIHFYVIAIIGFFGQFHRFVGRCNCFFLHAICRFNFSL